MRLFIAVPLPPPALEQAGFLLRGLMEREWPVRWVRDDGLHITLKFFGEVMPDRLDAIEDALRHAAAGIHSVSLALGTGGALPTPRRPRVLHLEVHAGPELEVLQDRLERACSEIGFAPEGRPFIPHITLGRVREGHRLPADAIRQLEGLPSGPSFRADRVVLFESRQTPGGPAYTVRASQLLV
ncbi:MAG TPA: RNA 2',3'-cyclic phosphodiesterase [Gemmatimonadales bacterium]|nr:RNA 2',3'-cyclic phosphodiesterase [Gemmatimonadales bacterium]